VFITRKELKQHFEFPKKLQKPVEFYPAKSLKLPKPLHKLRGAHYCTNLLEIGENYRIVFIWKEGNIREKCSIYAHLFLYRSENLIYPLARIDYHPSHKGLHILLNCEDKRDLSNRSLPGVKEFNLKLNDLIDPRLKQDRQRFIRIVCEKLGIKYDDDK